MKMFSRLLVAIFTVMFVAGLLVEPVKADGQIQDPDLTETEKFVKKEILESREADLTGLSDRTIHGAVIVAWWKDPAFKDIQFFKIKHATIDGTINAEGITLPFMVQFINCEFDGNINLESAKTKTFRIDNDSELDNPATPKIVNAPSVLKGWLRMSRMIVDGDVGLYKSKFYGGVTLFDAHISNNLFAKGSSFFSAEPVKDSKYPFELWTIYVGEKTEFSDSIFDGMVMAESAEFHEEADFSGSVFRQTANFKNFKVGNYANFKNTTFKSKAIFESGQIERDAAFTGAVFEDKAKFDYFTSVRFMDLDHVTFSKDFSFTYANIGWPYFASTVFKGQVNFEGMETPNDFDFTDAAYTNQDRPFRVYYTKVGGRVWFTRFSAPTGLNLGDNQFGSLNITGNGVGTFCDINLDASKIAGELVINDVNVSKLSAQDLEVKAATTFIGLKVMDDLNLSNAALGTFTMSQAQFWPDKKLASKSVSRVLLVFKRPQIHYTYKLNLRGTTFTDVNFVTNEGGKIGYQEFNAGLLGSMLADSVYSPQAYRTFEKFLTEKGRASTAAKLEFERKERERDEVLDKKSSSWLLSWFLYTFSGYGQQPEKALPWSLGIIIISSAIFLWQTNSSNGQKEEPWKLLLHCFLYSMFLFFSFAILEFAKDWEPEDKDKKPFFNVYKQIHKILGLIITPTAVLAFGGFIK